LKTVPTFNQPLKERLCEALATYEELLDQLAKQLTVEDPSMFELRAERDLMTQLLQDVEAIDPFESAKAIIEEHEYQCRLDSPQ